LSVSIGLLLSAVMAAAQRDKDHIASERSIQAAAELEAILQAGNERETANKSIQADEAAAKREDSYLTACETFPKHLCAKGEAYGCWAGWCWKSCVCDWRCNWQVGWQYLKCTGDDCQGWLKCTFGASVDTVEKQCTNKKVSKWVDCYKNNFGGNSRATVEGMFSNLFGNF